MSIRIPFGIRFWWGTDRLWFFIVLVLILLDLFEPHFVKHLEFLCEFRYMSCSPYFLVLLLHRFKHSHFFILFHFILSIDYFLNIFMFLSDFFESLWWLEIDFLEFLSFSIASPLDSRINVLRNLLIFLVSFHDSVNSSFTVHNCSAFINKKGIVQSGLIWHCRDVMVVIELMAVIVIASSRSRRSIHRALYGKLLRTLRSSQSSCLTGMVMWHIEIMREWV